MAAGIIGRKAARKTSGGSSGSSSSSRGTSESRREARMDTAAVAAAGQARKESNAARLSGASSAVQSAVKNANATAKTNIAEDAANQARRAKKASSVAKTSKATTINQTTNEVIDSSGNVVAKGSSLGEALAKQTQLMTGSAPSIAGRPDLYAVAPGPNQKVESYVDEATGKTVTPKVATPEQLQQVNEGTLESYDKMLEGIEEPATAPETAVVPEAPVPEAPVAAETAQEEAPAPVADTLAVAPEVLGTEATTGTRVLNESELDAYRQAGATESDFVRGADGSMYLKPGTTMQSLWDRKIPFAGNLNATQRSGISDLVSKGGHGINGTFNETDARNFAYATKQLSWQKFMGKSGSEALQALELPYVAKADATASSQSMEDSINGSAADLYDKTSAEVSTTDKYTRESAKTEVLSDEGVDLGATWASDRYVELFGEVNAKDIAAVSDSLIENQKELDKIKILEDSLVSDIRKEVSGEAPESYIQALALDRASAYAPRKAALMSERTALTTQQSEMRQTAKEYMALELQDRENALTNLDAQIAKGILFEDLAPSSVAAMDKMYGEGFTQRYMEASAATTAKKTTKEQAATTFQVYSDNNLWGSMSAEARKAMETSLGLPAGTIDSLAAKHDSDLDYKYLDGPGESLIEVVTDPNNNGKLISRTTIGNTSTGEGPGEDSKGEKEIKAFQADAAGVREQLDAGPLTWGAAWDLLHVKYPSASNEKIDDVLGGGYDQGTQSWYGRASESGGSANPATGNWVGK